MSPRAELQQLLAKLACDSEPDATSIDVWDNPDGRACVATVVRSRQPRKTLRVYVSGAESSAQAGLAVLDAVKQLCRGGK